MHRRPVTKPMATATQSHAQSERFINAREYVGLMIMAEG
jgi:hypothetical protein